MKILHTADWHIGKVLHKHSLHDEMNLFLDWIFDVIDKEDIDVLLISGDIFDVANPSVRDRKTYYHFLARLIGTDTQVIITGGNHDSISLIDAPQEILEHINITVIGGARENIEDEIIEVKDITRDVKIVVAAVPFLRDKDLRDHNSDYTGLHRSDLLKIGIQRHYEACGKICSEKYPNIPAIAMGHLYARGVSTSDSERDIHVGNAAAIESSIFPEVFDYIALGHIHRPQVIGGSEMIRYSGSPIALSFSEKLDQKSVVILELEGAKFKPPRILKVPKKRALIKISGTFDEVSTKLETLNPEYELVSFVELEINETDFNSTVLANVESLVNTYSAHEKFRILKSRTQFINGANDTSNLFEKGVNIEDLDPKDVFSKRLIHEKLSEGNLALVKEAFQEIIEEIQ